MMDAFFEQISSLISQFNVMRLIAAALAVIIARWFAHRSRRWMERIFAHTELTPSLETLIVNIAFYGILISGLLLALGLLGLPI